MADAVFELSLDADGTPQAMAATPGALWISVGGTRTGTLLKIDPTTGQELAVIETGWAPSYLAVGGDLVWISETAGDGSHPPQDEGQNHVTAVEASTGREAFRVPLPQPGPIGAAASGVWAATASSTVVRIDAASHKVAEEISIEGGPPTFLRADADVLVVTSQDPNSSAGTITIVDQASGAITHTIHLTLAAGPALFAGQATYVPTRDPEGRGWRLSKLAGGGLVPGVAIAPGTDVNSLVSVGDGTGWAWTTDGCAYRFDLAAATVAGSGWLLDQERGDPRALASTSEGVWLLDGTGVVQLGL